MHSTNSVLKQKDKAHSRDRKRKSGSTRSSPNGRGERWDRKEPLSTMPVQSLVKSKAFSISLREWVGESLKFLGSDTDRNRRKKGQTEEEVMK